MHLAEVVYPSLGMWNSSFRDPVLVREAMKVANDWAQAEIMAKEPKRLWPTAQGSMLDIDDAIAEVERSAEMGFRSVFMPTTPPPALEDYNRAS